MGANQFEHFAAGETAKKAFDAAVAEARHDYGHAGYTGTIAEKREFTIVGSSPSKEAANEMADQMFRDRDKRIDDKWGPAGCIEVTGTKDFLFFGWASS